MNDDDLSARTDAASAYLDGELDENERASVSVDPESMALVDTFAHVRTALGKVDPVPDDIKTAAISAALAQFDAVQLAASKPSSYVPATVTSLHSRRVRAYRVLTRLGAAAAIVVVVIAALNASKGSDMKSSAPATVPSAAVGLPTDSPVLKTAAASAGTAAPSVLPTESASMIPAVNDANDLARYASSVARDATAPAATTPAGVYGGAVPSATKLTPAAAAPPATCLGAADVILGPISVLGAPAFAVRDTSTGVVRAIAALDCRVLLTAP